MPNQYKELLDEMIWSFSRIHCYEQCPYSFYLKYIEKKLGIQNYYAANGKLMHSVIERVIKGEIKLEDAPAVYIEEYDLICEKVKQSIMDSSFEKCCDYLCTVEENMLNNYEILGVELSCNFKVGKYKFRGYIDVLLKNKVTGDIIVVDHKSSGYPLKKDGAVLKNCIEEFLSYKHQMYLYSKFIIDNYGKPSKIVWNHFKDGGKLTIIDFNEEEYQETLNWAKKTIQKIYRDKNFIENKSYMMCNSLCDYRDECEYKNED